MSYPKPSEAAALVAALVQAQEAGDREGEVLVLDGLERGEAVAALVTAVSLARQVMARTPGGVPAWLAALREMESQ